MWSRSGKSGLALAGLATLAAVLLSACGGSVFTASTAAKHKAVITWAEPVGSTPDYIFPMEDPALESNANLYQLDNQLYLPLYWFGDDGNPAFNPSLSVAHTPVFSDNNTALTITLKHWRWSNGAPITARDLVFWMNLVSAATDQNAPTVTGPNGQAGPGFGAFVPGTFPQNVVSYQATGTYTLTMKLNASYNPTWFLYNELSQVYPIPQSAWDKLSPTGSVGNYDTSAQPRAALPGSSPPLYVPQTPGTGVSGALGVAQFLNLQSDDLTTYATNPLWKVVDGPFKLSQFTTSGFAKLVPNAAYSGSPKPTIAAFEELPFTSDASEFNQLRSGSLTIGYIPPEDIGELKSVEKSGSYSYSPWLPYGFTYMAINFSNQTSGAVFDQLYFRQAMQSLLDQPRYIKNFLNGAGSIDQGPVPTHPSNPFASPLEKGRPIYPYNPTKAVALLKANGWQVEPGGSSYCAKPGTGADECGAGISLHQLANFNLLFSTGIPELADEMAAMQSTFKQTAGISLTLSQQTTNDVLAVIQDHCTVSTPCNNWDLADISLGFTWSYGPDFLPTGEELFVPGGPGDSGGYNSTVNAANVAATETAPTEAAEIRDLATYQNYLAKQLPVIYLPVGAIQLTMYKSTLKGLVPQDPFDIIYPQQYRVNQS
jgi:peptide/nickel transport system substrate-binding protein